MAEEFISPRFTGKRFDEHTLPLDTARDLGAYEDLVLALAKHLYREKHSERTRVPRGFAEGFNLHLQKTEEGSTIPALVLAQSLSLTSDLPDEIFEAKNLINEVIACDTIEDLPSKFPKDLYPFFDRIGRSLQEGEAIEWTPNAKNEKSILTPAKRKRLALAHQESYEAQTAIVGKVVSVNREKLRCQLKHEGNRTIEFVFNKQFFKSFTKALADESIFAYVSGVGEYDVNDRLQTITEIDNLEIIPHYPLVAALEPYYDYQDGWLEGEGKAPKHKDLALLSDKLVDTFPVGLPYPSLGPDEEGNIVLEWIRPELRFEVEVNFAEEQLELYSTIFQTDDFLEKIISLKEENCWKSMFAIVKNRLQTV